MERDWPWVHKYMRIVILCCLLLHSVQIFHNKKKSEQMPGFLLKRPSKSVINDENGKFADDFFELESSSH